MRQSLPIGLPRFFEDERGATAIEYGLLAALIAMVAITAFSFFGSSLGSLFNYTANRATAAMNNAVGG